MRTKSKSKSTKAAKKSARKATRKGAVKGRTTATKVAAGEIDARGAYPKSVWENIPDSAKIKRIGDNPRRKGSFFFKEYERMGACRTVGAYIEKGGKRRHIPGAVARGFIAKVA
jgi:hypothetical protein